MRVPLIELLEKLAVDRELYPYETQPWVVYDEDQGITCSAEVRMGAGGDDVEAEIQFLYDDDADIPELYVELEDEDDDEDGDEDEKPKIPLIIDGRMQVLIMRAEPITDNKWGPKRLTIKGIDYVNAFHDWEVKGCNFFTQCVQAINMGEIPDIDTLIEKEMRDDSWGGGKRGRIGRKSLRMAQQNPHQNNMKKGM